MSICSFNQTPSALTSRLTDLSDSLRDPLRRVSLRVEAAGMAKLVAEGQLLRPIVAVAGLGGGSEPPAFWRAVAAVQLAHEASLVHDDVVDSASHRRGRPTVVAADGVGGALLRGDHLLTTAYRVAADTGSGPFIRLFTRAVERTVAGEVAQARARKPLDLARYSEIVLGKSGELLGCALATGSALTRGGESESLFELGRQVGLLYQMLDDLLDACEHSATGKPSYADYTQGRLTLINVAAPELPFGLAREKLQMALHAGGESSAAMRAFNILCHQSARVEPEIARLLPGDELLSELVRGWIATGRRAVLREAAIASVTGGRPSRTDMPKSTLAVHSRSFYAASRFFSRAEGEKVARVYAFCRATDNLVDRPDGAAVSGDVLDEWEAMASEAYHGKESGVAFLDASMREMAQASVPFTYVNELIEGMRMDLKGTRYETMTDLKLYCYRVASVVGLWLTRLNGTHDPALLDRAERLGYAMQLTNIARDVGEDWRQGRLYLPAELLARHGVTPPSIEAMVAGAPISRGYRAMIDELLSVAETEYALALEVVPRLPASFARPVAVAAYLYRGIHAEIREQKYDNLNRRAYTTPFTKARLAMMALWELHRGSRSGPLTPLFHPPRIGPRFGQTRA